MKKTKFQNNIFIVARKAPNEKTLDYYIQLPSKEEHYLFTRKYSAKCYEECKASVPLNHVLHKKRRDRGLMNMVNYLNFIMPYFVEYFELNTIS